MPYAVHFTVVFDTRLLCHFNKLSQSVSQSVSHYQVNPVTVHAQTSRHSTNYTTVVVVVAAAVVVVVVAVVVVK